MYFLLRLFVGWFSIKFTSHYIYSWDVFGYGKTTECKFVHPVTSTRGVVFIQIYILLRLFVGAFGVLSK